MDLASLCDAEVSLLAVIDPSKDLLASKAASIAIVQEEQSISSILEVDLTQLRGGD